MFPSVRFLSLVCLLPALGLGCAADDSSVDATEDDLTASLGTQALWLVPNGAEPKDDLIHAIAPQGGNKARVVYSYPGGDDHPDVVPRDLQVRRQRLLENAPDHLPGVDPADELPGGEVGDRLLGTDDAEAQEILRSSGGWQGQRGREPHLRE
jgi:hypothetical protein